MGQRIVQVDAFTGTLFTGNPAAVCLLPSAADEAWMKAVAREMNLSETAFLWPEPPGFRLRWLSPTVEVDLCGHATLATAHVLWEDGVLAPDQPARFATRSGPLTATRRDGRIEMDFPATPARAESPPVGLAEALSAPFAWTGRTSFDWLVELDSEQAVLALRPNFSRLAEIPTRGIIATARSDRPSADFVSRFFAPCAGVNEDPVTGSAHCALAPYWGGKLGKEEMIGHQVSARGGMVGVRLAGDRVIMSGEAVTVFRGELTMDAPRA